MSVPLTELHVKTVVDMGMRALLANPDQYLPEIFGDYKLDPHAALFGQKTIEQVKKWLQTTKIPVKIGYQLTETELPCVTVNVSASTPAQSYLGDQGLSTQEILLSQEREIIVPAFQPGGIDVTDPKAYVLTLPPDMPFDQQELVLPGLRLRDPKGREYDISCDDIGNTLILQRSSDAPLNDMDYSSLEVVSPIAAATFNGGAMLFDETVTIGIFGHASRQEGLWLYAIVMWSLLKFRPVLIGTFGLDVGFPSASDYVKDEEFGGENVWRRFISLSVKTVYSWEAARQQDILGYLLTIHPGRAS